MCERKVREQGAALVMALILLVVLAMVLAGAARAAMAAMRTADRYDAEARLDRALESALATTQGRGPKSGLVVQGTAQGIVYVARCQALPDGRMRIHIQASHPGGASRTAQADLVRAADPAGQKERWRVCAFVRGGL